MTVLFDRTNRFSEIITTICISGVSSSLQIIRADNIIGTATGSTAPSVTGLSSDYFTLTSNTLTAIRKCSVTIIKRRGTTAGTLSTETKSLDIGDTITYFNAGDRPFNLCVIVH